MVLGMQPRPVANGKECPPKAARVAQEESVPGFALLRERSVMLAGEDLVGQSGQEISFRLEVPVETRLLNLQVRRQGPRGEPIQPGVVQDFACAPKYRLLV